MKVTEEEIEKKELNTIGEKDLTGGDEEVGDDDSQTMLDYIKECPAIFQSQQMGDPDLTKADKRRIAQSILLNKPVDFLIKFGKFLTEDHLNYFLRKYESSYEINYYVTKYLKSSLGDRKKNVVKRNRRFEAMKRMENEGSYFCEAEMEKREPLLYHQMVGQYLSEQEKLKKNWEANKNVIPTFSNFLIDKLEKEELNKSLALQQDEEDRYLLNEVSCEKNKLSDQLNNEEEKDEFKKKWGTDWEDEEKERIKVKSNKTKKQLGRKPNSQERALLFEEFKSIMQNKFLSGQEGDFNYSDIDSNSDYDCLDIRAQDEEEKYFDNETCDSNNACTDTGVQDY